MSITQTRVSEKGLDGEGSTFSDYRGPSVSAATTERIHCLRTLILAGVRQGLTPEQIARAANLSLRTVSRHLRAIRGIQRTQAQTGGRT